MPHHGPNEVNFYFDISVFFIFVQEIDQVVIPETDDDEDDDENETSQIHCFSPRTRRSITGRRSIKLPAVDSEDDEIFTDDEKPQNSAPSSEYKSAEETKEEESDDDQEMGAASNYKRNRSLAPNDSAIIRTPNPKRFSMNASNKSSSLMHSTPSRSLNIENSDRSDAEKTSSIEIESSHEEYRMKSMHNDSDSIVLLNSSDEENTNPRANSTAFNFNGTTSSSTPSGVKLVQPKLNFNGNKGKTFVSRAYYTKKQDELNALRQELKENEALFEKLGHGLPDKGRNLNIRMVKMRSDLQIKQREIDSFAIEEDNLDDVQLIEVINNNNTNAKKPIQNWRDDLESMQPRYTGEQGMATFNQKKTLTLDRIEKLHKAIEHCPKDVELARQPDHLNVQLMPHQLYAIKWMRWRESDKPKGGLLADDMGLGKTLTVIGLVLDAKYGKNVSMAKNDADDRSEAEEESDDEVERGYNKSYKNQGIFL